MMDIEPANLTRLLKYARRNHHHFLSLEPAREQAERAATSTEAVSTASQDGLVSYGSQLMLSASLQGQSTRFEDRLARRIVG
jgi:hypothetical protein